MPEPEFESIGELISANIRLKDEALGWHARAAKLEDEKNELEIEISVLKEQKRQLAIENVKLLNKPLKNEAGQYATDDFPNNEPLQDHIRKRDVSPHQSLHSATG